MFDRLKCTIFGHSEEFESEYHWDIPLNPAFISDECMRDGFVSCQWDRCARCGDLIETTPVPTEEAPSPVETAPLIPDAVAEDYA